jgi:acyl-CoA thioester hydrolase
MYVSDPGRSSFESWCTLARVDDPDTVYAAGGATTVWVNFPRQKSAPMPERMRAHLV